MELINLAGERPAGEVSRLVGPAEMATCCPGQWSLGGQQEGDRSPASNKSLFARSRICIIGPVGRRRRSIIFDHQQVAQGPAAADAHRCPGRRDGHWLSDGICSSADRLLLSASGSESVVVLVPVGATCVRRHLSECGSRRQVEPAARLRSPASGPLIRSSGGRNSN